MPGGETAGRDRMRAWLRAGGLRKDADRDGVYEHSDAIRILDAWWPLWVRAEFRPGLGTDAFKTLTATIPVDDSPNGGGQHHGSPLRYEYWALANNWRFLRRHGSWLAAQGHIDGIVGAQLRFAGRRALGVVRGVVRARLAGARRMLTDAGATSPLS